VIANESWTASGSETTTLAPRPDDAVAFLRALYPDGPWALTSIDPEKKVGTRTVTYAPDTEGECREWIAAENDARNVYYHIGRPRRRLSKKATKADVAAVHFLHADLDPRAGEDLDVERSRMLRRLTEDLPEGVPPPSFVVDSGGGYQALWQLRAPITLAPDDADAAVVEAAAEAAEQYTRGLELAFGADATHNVDRVLRVPGTVNWPDERKRAKGRTARLASLVETHPERVYDLAHFQAAPRLGRRGAAEGAPRGAVAASRITSVDELPAGVPGLCKLVIVQGKDPDDPKRFPSRSEALWYVCCELVRAGCDDATILGVIQDARFDVSASVLDKGARAADYAAKQVADARAEVEAAATDFETTDKGAPYPNQHNIRVALGKLCVGLEHDDFADRDQIRGLEGFGPVLDDRAMNRLRLLIDQRFHFLPSKELFQDVVTDLAMRNRRHPVREYLSGLLWDGTPRVDRWLVEYAGAEDSEYVRAVGALVLIAAVRRVRQPGCKFDEMLVMEGAQGKGKSVLLATLAVRDDWFSDDLPLNADTKRQMEVLAGRWIVEAGELKGIRKGEVEALKGFLSRQVDRARMAYGRLPIELRRQCVIVGTTNSDRYLRDATGNRRFWPVQTTTLRIDQLARDRDHLWAEAAHRESAGESIRLDPRLYPTAAEAQEARLQFDPYLETLDPALGGRAGKISARDVWRLLGKHEVGQRTQDDMTRLGDAMRKLGWERTKRRFGGAGPEWAYVHGSAAERERALTVVGGPDGWSVADEAGVADPELPM
jgi:Virulence-associated protein E